MDDLRSLYEDIILDHNRKPRNYPKKQTDCNSSAHGHNPLCGDEFTIHLTLENNIIKDIGFEGAGCAISTASASMMTEAVKGKSKAEAAVYFNNMHQMLTDDDADYDAAALGKLSILAGVKEYPMRVKCATLSWHVLNAALKGDDNMICTE